MAPIALMVCAVGGCAPLRFPAIDPSGDRIFLPPPAFTSLAAPPERTILPAWPRPAFQAPADPPTCLTARPVLVPAGYAATPWVEPDCPPDWCDDPHPSYLAPHPAWLAPHADPCLPGSMIDPCAQPMYPVPSPTAAVVPVYPQPPAVVQPDQVPQFPISATPPPGPLIGQSSRSGSPWRHQHAARLSVNPMRIVAPVGREVVLRAGLCDSEGFLIKRQPIEWSLSQDSVGTIVEVDQNESGWFRHLFHKPPQKQSGNYAVGVTSTDPQLLTQSTLDPNDDIWILEGQTWVSVTSASEGASHVTAVAPTAAGWEDRRQSATIYWVDGRWQVPPPAVVGSNTGHVLTTRVVRATSGLPVAGWLVRYEVTAGTPASLDAQGSQTLEAVTDSSGQASVTVVPQQPSGLTHVKVQVIRTGATPGDLPRHVVSESVTAIHWSTVALPAQPVPVAPTPGLPVPSTADPVMPPATVPPATDVGEPPQTMLDVQLEGPQTAGVGDEIVFRVVVTNRGNVALPNVLVKDRYDPGLRHIQGGANHQIEWVVGTLAPGESRSASVRFTVMQPGRHCHTVEATSGQGGQATRSACIEVPAGTYQPPNLPGAGPDGNPAGAGGSGIPDSGAPGQQGGLQVTMTGPPSAQVGDTVDYRVVVTNRGPVAQTVVRITYDFDPAIDPIEAEAGWNKQGNTLLWNVPLLEPGQTVAIRVRAQVRSGGTNVCHSATAVSAEGARDQASVCITVATASRPGSSEPVSVARKEPAHVGNVAQRNQKRTVLPDLAVTYPDASMSLAPADGTDQDMGDPPTAPSSPGSLLVELTELGSAARVGDPLTLVVTVWNAGPVSDQQVTLQVVLPDGLRYVSSANPPGIRLEKRSPEGTVLHFTPIAELRARETAIYRIVAAPSTVAAGTVRVHVTSRRIPEGVQAVLGSADELAAPPSDALQSQPGS